MAVYEVEAPPEVFTEREQRARTLEAAALEIEVRGWTQFSMGDESGVCLVGGICALYPGWGPDSCPIVDGEKWVPNDLAKNIFGIADRNALWNWNDEPGRTSGEVTFLLRWRAEEIRDGWDA